ncbi:hypothetical protein B0A79_20590 [Flavobacterium piscis]|uniref:Uncharacterized protein n=1 Tax=Flavobacterium piscis TaxID=1114874 RepID=A0ABX2XIF0_9FLAO|nr:hypothetical protein [Flavobacterium piscis]OCB73751.1 hypothetical protein FLP_13835 [Flavobacterium piscis]OXE98572.1 hypothetical protein B0A79_20590 [Flavobacterium piscis]
MNYTDYIYQILGFVGLPALFTLYLTERAKSSIKSTYDRKLEEIKKENTKEIEEVKKEHSKEISQFQSELNYIKSKENFKFTKLHEKRFAGLAEIYSYLSQLLELLHVYSVSIKNQQSNNADSIEIGNAQNSFINIYAESTKYITRNMLFFDDKTEQLLIKYMIHCRDFFNTYDQYKYMQEINKEDNLDFTFNFDSEYQKLEKLIFPLKKEIEKEFRKFLGE